MGFWIFALLMELLIPLIQLFFGIKFGKKPPEEINYLYGYRTKRSMKNDDTWRFANKYMGKLWTVMGLILIPVSAIASVFTLGKGKDTIGNACVVIIWVQLALLFISIFIVEKALKKEFDDNGNRKNKEN